MKDPRKIIITPLTTEKSTNLREEDNKYLFMVDMKANKLEIKKAVEEIFKVKVDKVTTMIMHGKTKRFGLGPFIVADDKFYILSDDGVLTVIETSSKEYVELAKVKVLNGHDAWGPLAIANGRLLARDSRRMVCLDIRAHAL